VKSADELAARFRSEGRKVTPQRYRIFEALGGSSEHPTAEQVWEVVRADLPSMSLKTVYQTLHELAELGEIQALDLATGATRFDPNLDAHHHLVCEGCGQVHDLYADFTDVQVPDVASHGFTISATEIVFRGTCPECSARERAHAASGSR
jgi:Fe2+ or Zn2+ uptake regulation protein